MKLSEKPHLRDKILNDKERKNLTILDVVRKNGPISRTDISRLTGFNIVTVSNYINHYIDTKLVFEKELDESTGGRKPVLVSLNNELGYAVGVGVNPDSLVAVLVNLECRVLEEVKKERRPVNDEGTIDEITQIIEELLRQAEINAGKVLGIGIGIPGIVDEKNRTVRWPGALGKKDFYVAIDLKDRFESKLGVPVIIDNDASAAVLAEKWLGLGRDVRHVLYMFSGVGCGILIDGEVYRGATGAAGELGVVSMESEGDPTDQSFSSMIGRWEMDLGMARTAAERISQGKNSSLSRLLKGGKGKIRFKDFLGAVKEKDPLAEEVAGEAGRLLGRKIAFLVNLLNPEIVVVGGGIEECGQVLFDPVKTAVKEWAIKETSESIRIIPSAFGEKAVALGAVSNICREVFARA